MKNDVPATGKANPENTRLPAVKMGGKQQEGHLDGGSLAEACKHLHDTIGGASMETADKTPKH